MFGHIDGIAVGEIFEDRKHLRASGIHAPTMAGIWGTQEGAYSIVLSGGYALNCVNNYAYVSKFHTKNFFIDPVAHDGGTSIGAALSVNNE